jgi:hypothetical protein
MRRLAAAAVVLLFAVSAHAQTDWGASLEEGRSLLTSGQSMRAYVARGRGIEILKRPPTRIAPG